MITQQPQVSGPDFLVFDLNAQPIRLGDRLSWAETSGRYGEITHGYGKVTSEKLIYGLIVTDGGLVSTHWEWQPPDGPEGLYCRHQNNSPDHAHKTWAKVIVGGQK